MQVVRNRRRTAGFPPCAVCQEAPRSGPSPRPDVTTSLRRGPAIRTTHKVPIHTRPATRTRIGPWTLQGPRPKIIRRFQTRPAPSTNEDSEPGSPSERVGTSPIEPCDEKVHSARRSETQQTAQAARMLRSTGYGFFVGPIGSDVPRVRSCSATGSPGRRAQACSRPEESKVNAYAVGTQ